MRKSVLFLATNPAGKPSSRNAVEIAKRLGKRYDVRVLHKDGSFFKTFFRFLKAAVSPKYAAVIVIDLGACSVYPAVLAGLLGKKLIINSGELHYESAKLTKNWLYCQEIRFTEWLAQRTADAILVRGSLHKKLLEKEGYKNVYYFPDSVDVSLYKRIKPAAVRKAKKRLGLENMLVLCEMSPANYRRSTNTSGGMALVGAMRFLKNEKNVKGLSIGGGDYLETLKRQAAKQGTANKIVFLGRLPYEQLPLMLSLADVCIHIQFAGPVFETRTTQKLVEYMAAGKYVISPNIGEARRLVPLCGKTVDVRSFNDPAYWRFIAAEVKRLLKNRRELEAKKRAAQRIAEKEFDYDVLAARLDKILQRLN